MNYAPERPTRAPEEPRMPPATFDASYPSYPMPSHFSRNLPSSMQDEGLQHTTSMGLDSLGLGAGSRNYGIPGMGPDAPGGAMGSRAYGIPPLGPDGLGGVGSTYGINDVPGVGSMKPFEVDTGGATGSRAFSTPGVALDAPGAGGCLNSRAFGGPGSIPGIPGKMADPAGVAGSHLSSSPGMAFDAPGVIGSRAFPMPGMAPERPDPGSGFTIPKIDFADPGQRWNLPMTNVAAGLDLGLDRPNLPEASLGQANYSFPTAGSFVAEAYREGVPSYAPERFSAAQGVPGESQVPIGGAVEGCGNKPIAAESGFAATNGFGSSYPPPGRGDTYSGGTLSYGPPPGSLPGGGLPAFLHLPSQHGLPPYLQAPVPPESLGVPRMPPPLPCYAGPGFSGEPEGYGKALGSFSLPGAQLQPPLGGPCPSFFSSIPPTGSFIADTSMLGSPNASRPVAGPCPSFFSSIPPTGSFIADTSMLGSPNASRPVAGFPFEVEPKGAPRSVSKSVQVSPDSPVARGNASPPAKAAPRPVTKQSKKKTNRTCC